MKAQDAVRMVADFLVAASVAITHPAIAAAVRLVGRLAELAARALDAGVTDEQLLATLSGAVPIDTASDDAELDAGLDGKPTRAQRATRVADMKLVGKLTRLSASAAGTIDVGTYEHADGSTDTYVVVNSNGRQQLAPAHEVLRMMSARAVR